MHSGERKLPTVFASWLLGFLLVARAAAGPLLPPVQTGNLLRMTNANVRIDYDLATGRANFYWQNSLKIAGFYAGIGLDTYITDTIYTNRVWSVSSNQVQIVSTRGDLPTMTQVFILDQDNSFLTRLDVTGPGLASRWMSPLVMDTVGGVDLGTSGDFRALTVPFDNDSFTYSYNAMPINSTNGSYEVAAFYDNQSRAGLVTGSVSHDTWKTGVYFQGANNRLNVLNVYGGVTSSDTRDVLAHGLVQGNLISSPTVFAGCGLDWRDVLADYSDANARVKPKLDWNGGVPFGWNSWYAYTTGVSYSNATAASSFIQSALQTNSFQNEGVVYVNLDSFWNNLSDAQLQQFTAFCHSNSQKAGIYWTPFVYWGTESQGSNSFMTGTAYKWSSAYLRTPSGATQSFDNGIAIDPTHPGFRQMTAYYLNYFKSLGFDFLKLDFLSHGALEGVHFDPKVTTGIQAYNQGMQYVVSQNGGRMFLSAAISPIFPHGYTHARRIYCDASTSINDTEATMQAVTYGWWINGRLYQYSDPDMMKFAGGTANENQSRLINCAVSGTVFLNSDDLASPAGQALARTCLTNTGINEVARSRVSFKPIEGNTGTNAADVFVRQEGTSWYVAVFNYSAFNASKSVNPARLGISGTYTALDLWSGALSSVSGANWTVNLGARQAKLFRLGAGNTAASGPTNQALVVGSPVTMATVAAGTPPFSYVWRKNGAILPGGTLNSITLIPAAATDAGTYSVEVIGGKGTVTNSAVLTLATPPKMEWALREGTLTLSWPVGNTGWHLQRQTNLVSSAWVDMDGTATSNSYDVLPDAGSPNTFFRLLHPQ